MIERSILVVDDEAAIRRVLSLQLDRNGYRVETAKNGAEALERLSASKFDAVITDVNMPLVGGRELTRRIRADVGAVEPLLIVMSSQPLEDSQSWVREIENAAVLEKPISVRRLLAILSRHLGEPVIQAEAQG